MYKKCGPDRPPPSHSESLRGKDNLETDANEGFLFQFNFLFFWHARVNSGVLSAATRTAAIRNSEPPVLRKSCTAAALMHYYWSINSLIDFRCGLNLSPLACVSLLPLQVGGAKQRLLLLRPEPGWEAPGGAGHRQVRLRASQKILYLRWCARSDFFGGDFAALARLWRRRNPWNDLGALPHRRHPKKIK